MPFLQASSDEKYIKIDRLFYDSTERNEGNVSDYKINLREHIPNVIACELTGYFFPTSVTPTFLDDLNNKFDFTLRRNDLYTETFSVSFPSRSFTYQNVNHPEVDYCTTLEQLMRRAVITSPVFGLNGTDEVFFNVAASSDLHTVIQITGLTLLNFELLFASGANSALSANTEMGFDKIDYLSTNSIITSPRETKLDALQRLDIFIDEFPELSPFEVVYNSNAAYYGTVQNNPNVTRTQVFHETPKRSLRTLTIRLRIEGKPIVLDKENEHSLCLTVFSLSDEIKTPAWLQQHFVI